MNEDIAWIMFSYRLASETSTLRVRAWRILKRVGALSLQQSVCIVPATPFSITKLSQLRRLIEEANGGEVIWLDISAFAETSEAILIERFNHAIAQEYQEFINDCQQVLGDSLENRLSEMKRLQKQLSKIRMRDYFKSPYASVATELLCAVEESVF